VRTAIINKRAGGIGMLSGENLFKKLLMKVSKLLHAIQDVYLSKQIGIA
jgi:class I fructose-bisphosphate aldolase